jgi:hypothetical protein
MVKSGFAQCHDVELGSGGSGEQLRISLDTDDMEK